MDIALRLHDLQKSYEIIDTERNVDRFYQLADYVHELDVLEEQFFKLNDRVDLLPFYEGLLKRISKYEGNSEETKKVGILLYTATLTKTHSLRNGDLTNMIIDVIGFLDESLKNREKWENMESATKVYNRRNDYQKNIDAMVDEANDFIEKDVNVYVDEMLKTMKLEFDQVIDETVRLKRDTFAKLEEKAKAMEKLKENIRIRSLLRIFKVLGRGISHIGKEGKLIGKIIDFGTNTAKGRLEDPEEVFQEKIPLPTAVNGTAGAKKFFESNRSGRIQAIGEVMEDLSQSLKLNSTTKENKSRLQIIDEYKRRFEVAKSAGSIENCESIKNKVEKYINQEKKRIEAKTDAPKEDRVFVELVGKAIRGLAVLTSNIDMFEEAKEDDEKLKVAQEAIAEDEASLKKLYDFEGKMYETLLPNLIELQENVESSRKSLVSKSPVALNVLNWKLSDSLTDAKREMTEIFRGFSNEARIGLVMDKLMGGMTMVINIYKQIREYDEHSRLIQYIGDLHAVHFKQIEISDEKLSKAFTRLQTNVQSNILVGQYLRIVDAFKQIAFPYASSYLGLFQLPTTEVASIDGNLKNNTGIITARLDQLKSQILTFNKTVINNHDKDIFSAEFGSKRDVAKPFCVWKSESYRDEISKLVSGKEASLMADISGGPNYNAIKFKAIDIDLIAKPGANQTELDAIRKSLMFTMIHSGLSRYRCGSKYYRIDTPPQTIEFGKIDDVGAPSKMNMVYSKIEQGGYMLSPYTLWRIKLSGPNLQLLQKFEGSFDIELNGKGQYVRDKADICGTNLEQYYKVDDTVIRD